MNDPAGVDVARPPDEAGRLRTELAAAQVQIEKLSAMLREHEAFSRGVERARQSWAQTFDSLDQPIFLHDENGGISRANLAYAKRAGLPVKNLVGKVYWKLFPRRDVPFDAPPDEGDHAEFEYSPSPDETFLVRSVGSSAGLPPRWRLYIFQDITELKRAEAALRTSGQNARAIVESSVAIMVAVDRDRRIVEFNPAAERAFGYHRDEVLGRHVNLLYVDPDSSETLRRLVFDLQGMVGEVENRRKNGETFTCLMSAAVLRDDEGKALGILGTSLDVTERKRAEKKLREDLAELELIFENAVAGIAYTRDRMIMRVNSRFAGMLGYRKEELVGQSTEICYPSREQFEALGREAYAALAERRVYEAQAAFRRKDGSLLRVHLAGRAVDHARSGNEAIWVFEDITERQAAEEQLTRSEAYFRALVENGNDVVHVVDAEGVIRYQSPAIERLTGLRPAERIGRSSYEHIHPDDQQRVQDAWQRVLRGQARRVEIEFRMRHRDGSWRIVDAVSSGVFDARGELVGVVSLHDVTERRRAEQRLLRSLESTISAVAAASELREVHTAGHQRGVAALAAAIALEMGLDERQVRGVHVAGIVHDIGKMQVPSEILAKPTPLSDIEYALVRTHPQAGHDMLKGIDLPWPVAQIVLQHHERLDGSGYPRGLKGGDLLPEARILAVADVVEAMSSPRPYRPAHSSNAALEEIVTHRGVIFDAAAVDACVKLFRDKGYKLEKA